MFNIFSTKRAEKAIVEATIPSTPVEVIKKVEKPVRFDNTVEEIHETFYTEIERLLIEADIQPIPVPTKAALKAKALSDLGFTNCTDVEKGNKDIWEAERIEKENKDKQLLIAANKYFSARYPTYKLITVSAVERICDKYGLIFGPVSRYKGTVPDKNLEQLKKFKVKEEDKAIAYFDRGTVGQGSYTELRRYQAEYYPKEYVGPAPLEIVANIKDFDTRNMRLNNKKLVSDVPDPVVLCPVEYNGTKFYFIVTAWGPEASDTEIINPKNN